jgi:hypothetical protein
MNFNREKYRQKVANRLDLSSAVTVIIGSPTDLPCDCDVGLVPRHSETIYYNVGFDVVSELLDERDSFGEEPMNYFMYILSGTFAKIGGLSRLQTEVLNLSHNWAEVSERLQQIVEEDAKSPAIRDKRLIYFDYCKFLEEEREEKEKFDVNVEDQGTLNSFTCPECGAHLEVSLELKSASKFN